MASDRGESSGSNLVISRFDTTACTIADRANPRTSAHRISQDIPKARFRAWAIAPGMEATTMTSDMPAGPTRDVDGSAGDVGGAVACEEGHDPGHFVGPAEPAQGDG